MGENTDAWQVTESVTCVSCPECAFTFDADHGEAGGGYDCPACMEHRSLYLRCHVCGKHKWASTPERAVYVLAFHMDRHHRGWSVS